MLTRSVILLLFSLVQPQAHALSFGLTKFVRMFGQARTPASTAKAVSGLQGLSDKKLTPEQIGLKYFALGQAAFAQKKWPDAKADFTTALQYSSLLNAEIHEKIAEVDEQQNQLQDAYKEFQKVLDAKPNQAVSIQARFKMSKIELQIGKLPQALRELQFLERRSRHSPQYPDILAELLSVELQQNRRYLACRWARKIFARFPAHREVADWGVDLVDDKIDGMKVGCVPSQRDIQIRMQRLQLAGLEDEAKKEIDSLRDAAKKDKDADEKTAADMLLVQYYEMQGYPYEALQILVQYYDQKKNELKYQEQLGHVAAEAGEFQSAIGAFSKAYHLSPRSLAGRKAAFTAAYLSYQIQDYDGAYRRFTDLIKKNRGSKLAWDARWHLAWIEYLKGHYPAAEKAFRKLYDQRIYYRVRYRRHRRWHYGRLRVRYPYRDERTQYWLAMTLFRQQKMDEARQLFLELSDSASLSFYGYLAKSRLQQIPAPKVNLASTSKSSKTVNASAGVEVATSDKADASSSDSGPSEASDATDDGANTTADDSGDTDTNADAADADSANDSANDSNSDANSDSVSDTTSDASTDSNGPQLKAAKGAGDDESDANAETDVNDEVVQISTFKDPRLRLRFTRANELMDLGLTDWAKGELYEIERRTRNKTYLNMLMAAYVRLGTFDRAVAISDNYFGGARRKGGLKGARDLWQFAFPRAYDDFVTKDCVKFGVPKQMVWAIMRAESRFNPNAVSPVGARGLVQLMPYTAEQLAKLMSEKPSDDRDLLDPKTNIKYGTRYLARLLKTFSGYVPLVAAAYNAGPHRVYSWLSTFGNLDMDEFVEHIPFVETRNYVKKVVRNYVVYSLLYSKTVSNSPSKSSGQMAPYIPKWLTSAIPIKVDSKPSPRENWESIE